MLLFFYFNYKAMVEFNELRISPDGGKLIIDASIINLEYYKDVYIDAVIIDTQDTYMPNGPSSKPIFYYELPNTVSTVYSLPEHNGCNPIRVDDNKELCFTSNNNEGEKRVRLELDESLLGIKLCDNLFFVYIIVKGTPSIDTPCGLDNSNIMGVVFNLYPIYAKIMGYIRELDHNCVIPKNFIDMLLKFKALEISIKTGHYTQAIKYWNKFFKDKCKSTPINCGCHG